MGFLIRDIKHPRSNNPARKRPVPRYSRDFMEAVFPMSGSGSRVYLVWTGTDRSMSKPVAGNGYRISPSDSWHFPGGFRSDMASFLRNLVGNSWNPASGIIVLGISCHIGTCIFQPDRRSQLPKLDR
ncbi:unnamed protein product [Adineta ricciae]|uniref:Uncharacterized protein n=1 Tax=Adineta ricciae TaxID=249248 RepID=A0A815PT51_ADIRI|nr:unnamed protein product [Adineta ricciae]CAF1453542.1 unnamed protein product [Adineta ricciae]